MSSYQACPDRTHLKPVKRSAFCIKSMSNYLVTYVYALYLKLVWSWLSFERLS
ncbi:hypothetical protein Hanom_Chr11g01039971 [Helianthus anomalus]